ncbi:hypothetical protein SDC9_146270 [bioreactor metagenome]|uniref:Uncharacterized protein n=1 Tax=bioreactor metagenome TaxID=1076179 RepID=A0A645EB66_9ZZZZ
MQVEPYQAVQAEVELTGPDVAVMDFAHTAEQQCHGMLCYCVGRVGRNPYHMNLAESCLEVDVVVAGTAHGEQPGSTCIQTLNDLFGDAVIDECANHLEIGGKGRCLLTELGLKVNDFHLIL